MESMYAMYVFIHNIEDMLDVIISQWPHGEIV